MMAKRKTVGTGITRRKIEILFPFTNAKDREALESWEPNPSWDFPRWLENISKALSQMLQNNNLPGFGDNLVVDANDRTKWVVNRWERKPDDTIRSYLVHLTSETGFERVAFSKGWGYLLDYPYQSREWYAGKIGQKIVEIRSCMEREQHNTVAGHSAELMWFAREHDLKFFGEKRLKDFEEFVYASNKGNIKRKEKAEKWQDQVRQTIQKHSIDTWVAMKAARQVKEISPDIPREVDTIRKFITEEFGKTG